VDDAADIEALWSDPMLGDGITDQSVLSIPVGKPRDFFRTHPNKDYRRRADIYTHKPEGVFDEQTYIIAPEMRGLMQVDSQPCTLAVVVDRNGSPRIWPIKHPRDGEKDCEAWRSARIAAKVGIDKWVKLLWVKTAYQTRDAQPGYAPEPDWSKLRPFNDIVVTAFGVHGIIRDTDHPVYRELFGVAPDKAEKDDDSDL
jgi:hypothetical protein